MNYNLVNFEDFDLVHENENIEYKESFDKLPGDIWPTYSAFANTKGGLIILGIFFRDKNSNQDSILLDNYTLEDLSSETIQKYRQFISNKNDRYFEKTYY